MYYVELAQFNELLLIDKFYIISLVSIPFQSSQPLPRPTPAVRADPNSLPPSTQRKVFHHIPPLR